MITYNTVTVTFTLTFTPLEMAKDFASEWTHRTLRGHDMSAVKEDGSVTVTVYDVTEDEKDWIGLLIERNNDLRGDKNEC